MMLAAIAMSTVVLGIVAIVAMTGTDSVSTSSNELPTTISVELNEFKITMSATSVKPGDVTFQVKNNGSVAHNFAIPVLKFKTEMLNPGQSVTVVASDVAAGIYDVVCEVAYLTLIETRRRLVKQDIGRGSGQRPRHPNAALHSMRQRTRSVCCERA